MPRPLDRLRLAVDRHRSARVGRRRAVELALCTEHPGDSELVAARARLERLLTDNLLPVWLPAALHPEGGYATPGTPIEPTRDLVAQAQVFWFAARLAAAGHRRTEALAFAAHGFRFLNERLWDAQHGGCYWRVARTGEPTHPRKHLYGQAMALYALSEYALASGASPPRDLAWRLFEALERHAHDDDHPGFREFFERDWSPVPGDQISYLECRADAKQFNTHIHLMEAFTRFATLTDDGLVRDRLAELVHIQSELAVRGNHGHDVHDRAWQPCTGGAYDRVVYGHDLENAWMLLDACAVLQQPPPEALLHATTTACYEHGWDHVRGGYCYSGNRGAAASERRKVWWVQAEALLCALRMYQHTRHPPYFRQFLETLAWIETHQVDQPGGEWHLRLSALGQPSGDRVGLTGHQGSWKTPYHAGRALLAGGEILDALRADAHG
jgi:mannobiose 2-epimerase